MITGFCKYPAWLSQVERVSDTTAIADARKALENTITANEQADAERRYAGAVLAAIAEKMVR